MELVKNFLLLIKKKINKFLMRVRRSCGSIMQEKVSIKIKGERAVKQWFKPPVSCFKMSVDAAIMRENFHSSYIEES